MSVDTMRQPGAAAADPDLSMGLELLAAQNRERLIQSAKVAAVWVVLVALLVTTLLQLRIDLRYAAQNYGYVPMAKSG